MIPQIDNQITSDFETQVVLPSKTYKINNDITYNLDILVISSWIRYKINIAAIIL